MILKRLIQDKLVCSMVLIICFFFLSLNIPMVEASSIKIEGTVIQFDHRDQVIKVRTGNALQTKIYFNEKTAFMSIGGNSVASYSILPGDHIIAEFSAIPGTASRIRVEGESSAGELLFINETKLITAEGEQFYISPDAKFYLNGIEAEWKDLSPPQRAFVRVDPETKLAGIVYAIDLKKRQRKVGNIQGNINAIEMPMTKTFKKNDTINVLVKATPKKNVSFDIAGVAMGVPMKEVSPGTYKGTLKFQRNDIRRAYLAICMRDNNGSLSRIESTPMDVAITPPLIEPVYPLPGQEVEGKASDLFARLSSRGSLIRAGSISVFIDGKQINMGIDRNVGFVSCPMPILKPGKHTAKVVVSDEAGNMAQKSWSFYVR